MARLLTILCALPLAACSFGMGGGEDDGTPGVAAQGGGGTRTYAVADFSKVELRGADDVDIRVGPGFSMRADGDAEVLDHLDLDLVTVKPRDPEFAIEAQADRAVLPDDAYTIDRATGQGFQGFDIKPLTRLDGLGHGPVLRVGGRQVEESRRDRRVLGLRRRIGIGRIHFLGSRGVR